MTLRAVLTAAGTAAILLSASTAMGAVPAKTEGGMLVDSTGMTLYTFDKDPVAGGKSMCNGPCAKSWPPLLASNAAMASGDWTIVTRQDGSKQWAYKGKPLYLWSKDHRPGDKTGDGFKSVWHAARP